MVSSDFSESRGTVLAVSFEFLLPSSSEELVTVAATSIATMETQRTQTQDALYMVLHGRSGSSGGSGSTAAKQQQYNSSRSFHSNALAMVQPRKQQRQQ